MILSGSDAAAFEATNSDEESQNDSHDVIDEAEAPTDDVDAPEAVRVHLSPSSMLIDL
jgi:hypothetical protein